MKWDHPPVIKIYEAIGAVADNRVEINGNEAKVYSSSRNKSYDVSYSPEEEAIMTNDNGSYWRGYLGYPAIAFLMLKGQLAYEERLGSLLKNVLWKDINQKYKNNFEKTLSHILAPLKKDDKNALVELVHKIDQQITDLNLSLLGDKRKPPPGY